MKLIKRTAAFCLAALLMITLCACDASATRPAESAGRGQAEFDAYLADLLPSMLDTSTFVTGFLLLDPQAAGLPEPGSDFGWTTEEDWQEFLDDSREALAELETFEPDQLDTESQRTLALLKDFLARQLYLEDFYLLDANDLGLESEAATLGTVIAHAPYQSGKDFDRLFAMYEDLPGVFRQLIGQEQERQEAGAGMTRSEIALVTEELEKLIAGEPPAAQLLADELIDKADFLTDAEKAQYHEKNEAATAQYLVPAYEYLIEALGQLPGRSGAPGTAGRTGGQEYYKALLKNLGFDETPEELMHYLEERIDFYMDEISTLAAECEDIEALTAFVEDPDSFQFIMADSPEAIIAYLEEAAKNDFPVLEAGSVEVTLTPEALRAPGIVAYYVLAPLDQAPEADKSVFINDEQTGADYLTLAHEAFPGHLYQDVYAAGGDRSVTRRLVERSYTGATEGWGVYSEMIAAGWAQTDPIVAQIAALSSLTDRLIWAWAEIGVNYLGWTAQELEEHMNNTFGYGFGGDETYTELLAAMPGSWVPYGAGAAKLLDMRRCAETALGDAFDSVSFHTAVLDALPADFAALEAAVDDYIAAGGAAAGSAEPELRQAA